MQEGLQYLLQVEIEATPAGQQPCGFCPPQPAQICQGSQDTNVTAAFATG